MVSKKSSTAVPTFDLALVKELCLRKQLMISSNHIQQFFRHNGLLVRKSSWIRCTVRHIYIDTLDSRFEFLFLLQENQNVSPLVFRLQTSLSELLDVALHFVLLLFGVIDLLDECRRLSSVEVNVIQSFQRLFSLDAIRP